MRFRTTAIGVICTIVCSVGLAAAECNSTDKQQVNDVKSSWQTSWNAKNVDDLVKLYAADAVFLPSDGSRVNGVSEIKASFQAQIGSQISISSVKLDCSGEIAYDSGTYAQTLPTGKHIEGQYLVVLKRFSGGGGMGGKAAISGKSAMGGGGSRWLIVQHASTVKPSTP
jgi:uncharacterized protein (TIGR02246 family)